MLRRQQKASSDRGVVEEAHAGITSILPCDCPSRPMSQQSN